MNLAESFIVNDATHAFLIDALNGGLSVFCTSVVLSRNGWHKKVNFHTEEEKKGGVWIE